MKISASVIEGLWDALPVVLGCVPIGMAHGLLSQQAGLVIWVPLGMSLFVCAGASQFIAVSMLQSGAGPVAVVGTTFIVNFRHLLMSASIAPSLALWTKRQRLLTGCLLTDESFAVLSARFAAVTVKPAEAITLNATIYLAWALSVSTGFHLGSLIARPEAWGLDFALPAMFAGLLLPVCQSYPAIIAAVAGGVTAVLLTLLGLKTWAAFIGALVGATVGVFFGGSEQGSVQGSEHIG
ncbi:MAG: AzlC family ABC transporter permease [Synergistaceae bacterium]|jgi:4-azaleucine resistance transporter AzlC|nr:AzlC family ABC transporter permease [Synergistaceae bacterium]